MPVSIPISQIVQINPAVLAAAGSAIDLNGTLITKNPAVPYGQMLSFATPDDVSDYCGAGSVDATMAQHYFAGPDNKTAAPGRLYVARYPDVAISAFLRSASLADLTLANLQALSGSLSINIDGVVHSSPSIDFSGVLSFSAAAALIASSLSVSCVYDGVRQAFLITSGTTGDTSTISYATGTLADSIRLTSATAAVISQGSDAKTPAEFMDDVLDISQNWATFSTTWEPDLDGKKAFSDWANSKGPRFLYVGADSDVNAKVSGNQTTWGYYLDSNELISSCPIYGNTTHSSFIQGFAASLDFTRTNARATAAFKTQSGLQPSVNNASDARGLEDNKYNFYGIYANATETWNFFYPGSVSGSWKWLDTYLNQIWLNANLQLSMVNLLLGVGSIPYNDQGKSLVESACTDPINAALNFGAIRTGIILSEAQKAQIRFSLGGKDVSQSIQTKGYYLDIQDASPATRAARGSFPMTLYYTDGGSVQRLVLASISIQ